MYHLNEYGSVNGQSCSYVRLGRYNNCSMAEVNRAPTLSDNDYTFKGAIPTASQFAAAVAASQNAPVNPTAIGSGGQPVSVSTPNPANVNIGVTEGFYYAEDDASYKPSYSVPNYQAINTNSLTHGKVCGNYPSIIGAYGENSGNCVTNFINN